MSTRTSLGWLLSLSVLASVHMAGAQTASCATAKHGEFDFWRGAWMVNRAADNGIAGTSRVEKILDGCVLHERWQGVDGSRGQSFNFVDQGDWRQVWVDAAGSVLDLRGGLVDGAMVLRGKRKGRDGRKRLHEIRWTPQPNERVRQQWRISEDGGKTWKAVFDGLYTRSD